MPKLKLKNSKIPYVRLGTVMTNVLLRNFEKYSRLVESSGVRSWEFYRPMVPKTMAERWNEFKMSKSDLAIFLKHFRRLSASGIDAYIANAVPLCITDNDRLRVFLRGARFDDGYSRLVLDARGFFKPSYSIDLNMGETIQGAWSHPFRQRLMSLSYLTKKCQLCIYARWCLGGSRYMAHEYSGDYFARDPLIQP